jgi:hypothetical protein
LITAITGTYNGQAIVGLTAPGEFGLNNNLLYVGQPNLLDALGFSFSGEFGDRNIYWAVSTYRDLTRANITFSITEVTAGVPEPGTWAMMLLGFGSVGMALRARRKTMASAQLA